MTGPWRAPVRSPIGTLATVLIAALTGCTVGPPGGSQGPAATGASPATPAPSFIQGGVSGGGGGAGSGGAGPHTPRDKETMFFAPALSAPSALADVEGTLQDQSYPEPYWLDAGEPLAGHGPANLGAFKKMADYGIGIVDAFGDDQVLAVQQFCDPVAAVDEIYKNDEADLGAGFLLLTAIPGEHTCPGALNHDEQQWIDKIKAEAVRVGGNPNELAVHFPKAVADPGPVEWAIGVTEKGILSYLGHGTLSLLFLSSCDGHSLVGGLLVDAVFSYQGCGNFGGDLTALFNSLYGSNGIDHRGTDTAYAYIQASAPGLQYGQFGGPVLLSPAVVSAGAKAPDGSPTEVLVPGESTEITVTFDTEMDTSTSPAAASKGCGATIDGAETWNGDGTQLQFKVKIPNHPPDITATLVIIGGQAMASAESGWANALTGNGGGTGENGFGPNTMNDYQWEIGCEPGLNLFVDGLFAGKPVKGQVLGDPATELTCYPNSPGSPHAGNLVHWNGYTSETNTPIAGEFDVEYGTWPLGQAQGDQDITIDEIQPTFDHLASTGGTITQNPGGGSIDVTAADGADTVHVSGTWTCPPAGPGPS